MSRAFVREDRDEPVARIDFGLPPLDDPSYPAAAALALLEGACAGATASAEQATGYRFGDPHLHAAVRMLLEKEQARPEEEQDRRLIQVARRFLRSAP